MKPLADAPRRWARVYFPEDFRLGTKGLAQLCAWRVRADGPGHAFVIPRETYEGSSRRTVSATLIDSASGPHDRRLYESAAGRMQYGDTYTPEEVPLPRDVLDPATREEFWPSFRLRTTLASDRDLPGHLLDVFGVIAAQMPVASLWSVQLEPVASGRAAAARALFAAAATPEVLARSPDDFRGFPAGAAHTQSLLVGLSAYVEPLLMTQAPWLIGMDAPRRAGCVVVLFGQIEPGFVGRQQPELIDALRPTGHIQASPPVGRPVFSPDAAVGLLQFWVDRLDSLLAAMLDPTRFVDADGVHLPFVHLAAAMSVESLFTSVQALLSHAPRDPFVRQLLMFSVIDQLHGLGFDDELTMLTPNRARKGLAEVERSLPSDVGDLLLPRARRAVDALEQMRDEIALPERVRGGLLRTADGQGGWTEVGLDRAVAGYLRFIRNRHHSFTSMGRDQRDVSLFASWEGQLPDAIADLGLLHFVRFLLRPRLRGEAHRGRRDGARPLGGARASSDRS